MNKRAAIPTGRKVECLATCRLFILQGTTKGGSMKTVDLIGQRFGRLVVIKDTGKLSVPGRNKIWLCKCDCGKLTEVHSGRLRCGETKSCGCLRYAKRSEHPEYKDERLYSVWVGMRRRCRDKKVKEYKNYGGRGISVCEEWNEYSAFRAWALSTGYDENAGTNECTIDRINVNEDYCPENCRWVNSKVQNNNRRNNRLITYHGKTQTVAQWEHELGRRKGQISERLHMGWSVEDAIERPIQMRKRKNSLNLSGPAV